MHIWSLEMLGEEDAQSGSSLSAAARRRCTKTKALGGYATSSTSSPMPSSNSSTSMPSSLSRSLSLQFAQLHCGVCHEGPAVWIDLILANGLKGALSSQLSFATRATSKGDKQASIQQSEHMVIALSPVNSMNTIKSIHSIGHPRPIPWPGSNLSHAAALPEET